MVWVKIPPSLFVKFQEVHSAVSSQCIQKESRRLLKGEIRRNTVHQSWVEEQEEELKSAMWITHKTTIFVISKGRMSAEKCWMFFSSSLYPSSPVHRRSCSFSQFLADLHYTSCSFFEQPEGEELAVMSLNSSFDSVEHKLDACEEIPLII